MSTAELAECARRFAPKARGPARAERVGSGHIHRTWRVDFPDDDAVPGALLLQELNEQIFPDLDALQRNALAVVGALGARPPRKRTDPGPDLVLEIVFDADGAPLARDEEGRVWRAFRYVEGTRALDVADDPRQIHAAARAFGDFVLGLTELPPSELVELIPRFHDTASRIEALGEAVVRDAAERAVAVVADVQAITGLHEELREIFDARGGPELPVRVVHNDCKLNNALFDPELRRVRCVVDLDTTWAGTLLCDLGALLRTTAARAPEDEPRLDRIRVEPPRVEAAARGFMEGLGRPADELELGVLPLAGAFLALEDASRFLADHLDGDTYFPAHREGHNLDRARAQLAVARGLRAAEDEVRRALR